MLKRLMSSEFNKNVLKLMTGSTIAQAIPIAISPILTRIYTPNDFGVLALFVAITSIFGSIANARYELAIVLPEKEEDSINLVALSVLIAFVLSTILFICILIFHAKIISLIGNADIGLWLYFIPVTVFFMGLFNALNYLNTRLKDFGLIAKVSVIKSITLSIVQLGLGFLKLGTLGLISGQVASHVFSNLRLARGTLKNKALIAKIKLSKMLRLAKRYKDFPKFSMWATLINTISLQLNNFIITLLYSFTSLGYYSLVQKILGMPSSLIGTSIGQVFFQQASEERTRTGLAKNVFMSTTKKLFFISIVPFIVLFLISEELVTFVFGNSWAIAGTYMKILIPLFFIRFIVVPLSTITTVFEKQNIALVWQLLLFLSSMLVFFISYIFELKIINFLILYTIILSLNYLVLLLIVVRLSLKGYLGGEKWDL